MTLSSLSPETKQYLAITGNYWVFTLSDGALRMLVVLFFYQLGYSPINVALLFLFYEFFGVITNLVGGWLGARVGLNRTMNLGLGLQIVALAMLILPESWLTITWVMLAQALSGIAKDLNKMSAKSSVKSLLALGKEHKLFTLVALLTGSKNALKGVGFFLGGLLLSLVGFQFAIAILLVMLFITWVVSLSYLQKDLGKSKNKPKFTDVFSTSRNVNLLSLARFFLFGARDVWFVIALPIYLAERFQWTHWQVGSFLAIWVIGYGFVQSLAPKIRLLKPSGLVVHQLFYWSIMLVVVPLIITAGIIFSSHAIVFVVLGLIAFGIFFAINSSIHSYLIVFFAREEGVSLDVGFYYMSNAAGRLVGTMLSGLVFQMYGFEACLVISSLMLSMASLVSRRLLAK
jgi:predicted MFS family arabinose efflux permease